MTYAEQLRGTETDNDFNLLQSNIFLTGNNNFELIFKKYLWHIKISNKLKKKTTLKLDSKKCTSIEI